MIQWSVGESAWNDDLKKKKKKLRILSRITEAVMIEVFSHLVATTKLFETGC